MELTARSIDGGKDIIAISKELTPLKILIECKRYAPHNKVGISIVQRLHGVVSSEKVSKGIVVTSSSFTQPAKDFIARNVWQLEGVDFERLSTWLDSYQDSSIRNAYESMRF